MDWSCAVALQLADSFFPSGMYTQSHGLEQFVAEGLCDESQLESLLQTYLIDVAGPGEATAARWTVRAASDGDLDLVGRIDERLDATKLAPESRSASRRCGGRILLLGAEVFDAECLHAYAALVDAGERPGHQAVALALVGAVNGCDESLAVLIELHTYAVSIVSAAVRLGVIDHVGAQRLLYRSRAAQRRAHAEALCRDWKEIGGFAPAAEIAQFRHRYGDMHLFVS